MIRQGIPFIANKNMLFCIVEDTIDGTYRTINLSMGSIHGCNYPTVSDALDDLQKSWKIIDVNWDYVDIKTEIEEEREI